MIPGVILPPFCLLLCQWLSPLQHGFHSASRPFCTIQRPYLDVQGQKNRKRNRRRKVKRKMWELLLVGNMGQNWPHVLELSLHGVKNATTATPLQSSHICTHDHSGPIHRSQRGAQKGESCRSLCFFKHPTLQDPHRKINPHSKNFFHLLDDISVLNLLFQN